MIGLLADLSSNKILEVCSWRSVKFKKRCSSNVIHYTFGMRLRAPLSENAGVGVSPITQPGLVVGGNTRLCVPG